MKETVINYVKGCPICQMNKPNTHPNKPPLFPIAPFPGAPLFDTIAVDWIMKLPKSNGYDAIMTVTDHDCSKAVVFVPCREQEGTQEMAEHYAKRVFPHFGIP